MVEQLSGRILATKIVPLSPYQQRVWYLQQLTQQPRLFVAVKAFRLPGKADPSVLQNALSVVVNHHALLRTGFFFDGNALCQVVEDRVECALDVLDAPNEGHVQLLLERAGGVDIGLSAAPLVRCALIRVRDNDDVLHIAAHRLVWDDASFTTFVHELWETYGALTRGGSVLPGDCATYFEYSASQRAGLADGAVAAQLQRLLAGLANAPHSTSIPRDRPHPAVPTFAAGTIRRTLSEDAFEAVQAAEIRLQTHRSIVLLAVFLSMAFRHTGQSDLVVGVNVDGRRSLADGGVIGPFEEALPLRVNIAPDDSFETVVGKVRRATDDVFSCRDVPFKSVVDAHTVDRNPSQAPIFQMLFSFQDAAGAPEGFNEIELPDEYDELNLSVRAVATDDSISLSFKYRTELYVAERIERLASQFEVFALALLAGGHQTVSAARLLPDAEVARLIHDWNATARAWDEPANVIMGLIERHRNSAKTAVIDRAGSTSYEALLTRAGCYANALKEAGVRPGDVVGLCLARSSELIAAMLGCLGARAAYLPIDISLPRRRIASMVTTAQARLVICSEAQIPQLEGLTTELLVVDAEPWRTRLQTAGSTVSLDGAAGSDIAYVLFTSGSSGTPKGVLVPNSAVVNLIHALTGLTGPTEADRVMAHTTMSFDIHVLETLAALACHATLYVATTQESEDAAGFASVLEQQNITFLQCTPTRWQQLEMSGWRGKPDLKALVGGERLNASLARSIMARTAAVWNMYGPTETTVWSTCERLERVDGEPSIGRPIANTRVYVLDEAQRLAPIGVAGELYIAGAGVAAGYVAAPDLTDARFVELEVAPGVTERVYRTGDKVRYGFDGRLHFIERVDGQIKLRGFRIEPAEIERAIMALGDVAACAVVASGSGDEERLVAFVVPAGTREFSVVAARKALRAVLPSYMCPQQYQVLDALPLTLSGKVDRRRLAAIGSDGVRSAERRTAPRTDTEARMAAIWSELIHVDEVFVEDNFLDVGGNSLLSMTFIARWKRDSGVSLSPREVVLNDLGRLAELSDQAALT